MKHGVLITYRDLATLYDDESNNTLTIPGELSLPEAHRLARRIQKKCYTRGSGNNLMPALANLLDSLPTQTVESMVLDPIENLVLILSIIAVAGAMMFIPITGFLSGAAAVCFGLLEVVTLCCACVMLWPFGTIFTMAVIARVKQLLFRRRD